MTGSLSIEGEEEWDMERYYVPLDYSNDVIEESNIFVNVITTRVCSRYVVKGLDHM